MQPTTNERKIIVCIATSADGYIARPDGGIDWLNRPEPEDHYGMGVFLESIDTILWGRKTFDFGESTGGTAAFGAGIRHYVFTHHPPAKRVEGVEFVDEPPADFVRRLRSEPGKNVWMMGGAQVIGSFLDAGVLDEFLIHVIPVFIGEGIPLIAPRHRNVALTLLASRQHPDGVVGLHYRVG